MANENENLQVEKSETLLSIEPHADNYLIANYNITHYGSHILGITAQMVNLTSSNSVEDSLYVGYAIYDGLNGTGNVLYSDLNTSSGYSTKVSSFNLPALSVVKIPDTSVYIENPPNNKKSFKIGYIRRSSSGNIVFPLQTVNY